MSDSVPTATPADMAAPELRGLRKPGLFGLAVLAGLGLDLFSKYAVFQAWSVNSSYPLWPGVFHISPVYNPGVAFSMLKDWPAAILALGVLLIGALVWWYWTGRKVDSQAKLCAFALLLSGALGNLWDRLSPPYQVRDFLDFRPELPIVNHWATFNVADTFICVGVGLFVLAEFWPAKTNPKPDDVSNPTNPSGV